MKPYTFVIAVFFILLATPGCVRDKSTHRDTSCLSDSIVTNRLVKDTESLFAQGEFDETYRKLDTALKIFATCPDLRRTDAYLNALNNMGGYWIYKHGDYQKGLIYLKLALHTALDLHGEQYPEIPTFYNNIAFVYAAIGEYDSAAYGFGYALSIWQGDSLNNAGEIGKAYTSLSIVNRMKGDLNKALDYAYRSYNIRRKTFGNAHAETGEAYNNIGTILLDMGLTSEALDNFVKAEAILASAPDVLPSKLLGIYNNLGQIHAKLKNYGPSNEYFRKAMYVAQSSEIGSSSPDYALMLSNMGFNYQQQGNWKQALESYKKSLAIYEASMGPTSLDVAITYEMIGRFYEFRKQYRQALDNYLIVLSIKRRLAGMYHHDMELYFRHVADMYHQLGQFGQAYLYQDSAMMVKDSLQSFEKMNSLAEMKEKYESEISKEEIKTLSIKNSLAEIRVQNRNRLVFTVGIFSVLTIVLMVVLYRQRRRKEQFRHESELYRADMKTLRARMDPHFIFNSLNSIRGFISENTGNLAEDYLIRFSDLMRNILIQSGKDTISLAEELKTLELYLGLEKQRHDDRFTYHIEIDSNIDSVHTAFPSLILQPFAENAVKHAFGSAVRNGRIDIHIRLEEGLLLVSVTDNGRGLDTGKVRTGAQGMILTRSRIENYAALHKVNPGYTVSSSDKGTEIGFRLPFRRL